MKEWVCTDSASLSQERGLRLKIHQKRILRGEQTIINSARTLPIYFKQNTKGRKAALGENARWEESTRPSKIYMYHR